VDENPYLFTLVSALATTLFIVAACFLLGTLARFLVRAAGGTRRRQDEAYAGYFFAAPWIAGFLIFVVVPMLASLYWSFTDYRIGQPITRFGPENYLRLILEDREFRGSLVNTLFLTVIGVPLQIGVALVLAVLLNRKLRGEHAFRATFYLPVLLGFNAAVLLCWRLMLNASNGIIDQVIRSLSTAIPLVLPQPGRDRRRSRQRLLSV
jgi:multiple sugar transport system permease protein